MKKNKNKKFFLKKKSKKLFKRIFLLVTILILSVFSVYAIDVIEDYIKTQTSTGTGTNNNKITFSKHKTTYYIDKGNDDNFIGDELRGYYYDNIFGFFRLDWNSDISKNVHINSGSTNIFGCSEAYSFTGSAYSKYVGEIKFHYDSTKFVYYCKDDKTLYGTGYSDNLGAQIFDGIKIKIKTKKIINKIDDNIDFSNDTNIIEDNNYIDFLNKNWNNKNIGGGDKYEIENLDLENNSKVFDFWIIK